MSFQYIVCFGSTCDWVPYILNIKQFQYIVCFGSTPYANKKQMLKKSISIHRMFRFYKKSFQATQQTIFYFNTSYVSVLLDIINTLSEHYGLFQYIVCFGSTDKNRYICISWIEFQYIVCFGSTSEVEEGWIKLIYFNTSYVSVLRF